MPPTMMEPTPPGFEVLYFGAMALYGVYLLLEVGGSRWRVWPLAVGFAAHLAAIALRGMAIEYFPLTNKLESFLGFAAAVFGVLLLSQRSPTRWHRLPLFVVGATFYGLTLLFERGTFFPPPLMKTIWYPLHVPATFVAYALWTSAAAGGLALLMGHPDNGLRRYVEGHLFWGFGWFSVSMVFGGLWGYVAWGAYFLWDPKVVWSVVLWLYFAGLIHLRYWPGGLRPRVRGALALMGFPLLLVAYVGTSFLFAHSSHSFS